MDNRLPVFTGKLTGKDICRTVFLVLGGMILSFGLYHVHSFAGVTEGGILGLTLLLHHWLGISPAISGFALNAACYTIGWRILGRRFILYSAVAGGCFSLSYAVWERFEPLWPQLAQKPLAAAVIGAAFVGVGVGLCVAAQGAPTGDDALAMGLSKTLHADIRWIYLCSDLLVLLLSLSYIPPKKLFFSLITVILSGQIIGWMQKIPLPFLHRENAAGEDGGGLR